MSSGSFYQKCISELIKSCSCANVVQIGANDGKINDPIYDVVMSNISKTNILLIEPQVELISYLQENYSNHTGAKIWNGAIGPEGVAKFYRVKPIYWDGYIRRYLMDAPAYRVPSGFTSTSLPHVLDHARGNLPEGVDSDQAIEEVAFESRNLLTLAKENFQDFMRIDILQIDTEGMDRLVLMNSNIDFFKPGLINFEHAHLSQNDYSDVMHYLQGFGYKMFKWSRDDTLAIKHEYLPLMSKYAASKREFISSPRWV
jgi:FkbM family methyltransferase